jgi:hypothetical protein
MTGTRAGTRAGTRTKKPAQNRRRKKVPLRRPTRKHRSGSTIIVVCLVGLMIWAIASPGRAELRRRQEWKRIGSCRAVNSTSPSVTCRGVTLVQLQLPRSFAACPAIRAANPNGICEVPVNKRVYQRFADAVHQIDAEGLGKYVTTFGTVNRRRCKNAVTGGYIKGCISKHSYGLAADIREFHDNANWAQVVRSEPKVQRVIDIFIAYGFRWGRNFSSNPDPQHVEWTP